ncbi:MAG: class I SAM-dependent methyltransferase [Thermoanaerobaculales bacterium]|nr:class I SAM-dependent methyltransferase [Thermoanaerobaculales bacterium]
MSDVAAPWRPLGRALAAYHRGDTSAELVVSSDLWEDETVPVAVFYRPVGEPLPELERRALEHCRGRVLDLGAGAGRHALELQERGLEVVALDPLAEAVAIMRERGVADPRRGELEAVAGERFDTVLMLMHGLGVVGDLRGLGDLLERLPDHLEPGGRLVFDSADLAGVLAGEAPELLAELEGGDRYPGEVAFSLRFGGIAGPSYPWLFVDPETVGLIAGAAGCRLEVVATGDRGAWAGLLEAAPTRGFTRR